MTELHCIIQPIHKTRILQDTKGLIGRNLRINRVRFLRLFLVSSYFYQTSRLNNYYLRHVRRIKFKKKNNHKYTQILSWFPCGNILPALTALFAYKYVNFMGMNLSMLILTSVKRKAFNLIFIEYYNVKFNCFEVLSRTKAEQLSKILNLKVHNFSIWIDHQTKFICFSIRFHRHKRPGSVFGPGVFILRFDPSSRTCAA